MAQANYPSGKTAGHEAVDSVAHIGQVRILESALTHPTHADGLVDKGDPIQVTLGGIIFSGVAINSATASTEYVDVSFPGARVWNLSVTGVDNVGNAAIAQYAKIYLDLGVLNLDAANGIEFGVAMAAVVSGATTVIPVALIAAPLTI
jgi:hypothetical protein